MRRLTVAAALAAAFVFAAIGSSANSQPEKQRCSVTAREFRPWAEKVWRSDHWKRSGPKTATLMAYRHKLSCAAGPGHKKAMKRTWRSHKRRFYRYRAAMLFRIRVTPFYCSDSEMTFAGGWYAIPCANVNAESGGRGGWTCNTYGIIGGLDEPNASSSTWVIYGGTEFAATACSATEREQSIVAARIYRAVGTSAWTPFE